MNLTRRLRWAGGVILIAALLLGIAVDALRVRWDLQNDRFIPIVRASEIERITLSALADAGVRGIGLRASEIARGAGMSAAEVVRAGLVPVLIVDQAVSPAILDWASFPYFWIEGALGAGDPLIQALVKGGSTLIAREFEPRAAEQDLWKEGYHRFVRGHEIPRDQLPRLTPAEATMRCVRAVRERGIRALVLPDLGAAWLRETIAAVEREGLSPGEPAATPPVPPRTVGIGFHIGISALVLLVFIALFPRLPIAGVLLAAGIGAIACGLGDVPLRQLDAFLLAAASPIYLFLILRPQGRLRGGLGYLLLFTGGAIASSLLLAGILSHPAFILKIYGFRGVKAALLIPPVGAVAIHMWRTKIGLRDFFAPRDGARWGIGLRVGAVLLGGIAAWLILIRSGNAPGLAPPWERETRGLLEKLLIARPRFKEFLIGHPGLLLFGTKSGSPFLRTGYLFFGMFGQASIMNSFAHAHTPILLTLLRTGNGLGLGLALGLAGYGVILLIERVGPWVRSARRRSGDHPE
ncbi:hypothetical protein DRJ23_04680 [Candidatus Acetothermia bacterium]|nr:MAG: hypothetical protein DRJ23_04680 [Candidatus Acetothermia bacterium]